MRPFWTFWWYLIFLSRSWSQGEGHGEVTEEAPVHDDCLTYNINYPQHCEGECSLASKWSLHNDTTVHFVITALTEGDNVWVGIGFSENGKMAGSDTIVCWYYKSKFYAFNGQNSNTGHSWTNDTDQSIVELQSGNYTDGRLTCSFKRMLKPLNNSQDVSLSKEWYVLLSWGQITESVLGLSEPRMNKHALRFSSVCSCNVTDCSTPCLCTHDFNMLLLRLHGSLMSLVFLLVIPTAVIIVRYYRTALGDTWFKAHALLMVLATVSMIASLGLILGHTRGAFTVGYHQTIGVITIGLAVIQVLVALVRPAVGTTLRRKLFEVYHRTNAVVVLITGNITLFLGAYLLHKSREILLMMMVVTIGTSIILSLITISILELYSRWTKYIVPSHARYHKVLQLPNDTESEDEVYVKDNLKKDTFTKQKIVLILFIFMCICTSGTVIALVFL